MSIHLPWEVDDILSIATELRSGRFLLNLFEQLYQQRPAADWAWTRRGLDFGAGVDPTGDDPMRSWAGAFGETVVLVDMSAERLARAGREIRAVAARAGKEALRSGSDPTTAQTRTPPCLAHHPSNRLASTHPAEPRNARAPAISARSCPPAAPYRSASHRRCAMLVMPKKHCTPMFLQLLRAWGRPLRRPASGLATADTHGLATARRSTESALKFGAVTAWAFVTPALPLLAARSGKSPSPEPGSELAVVQRLLRRPSVVPTPATSGRCWPHIVADAHQTWPTVDKIRQTLGLCGELVACLGRT